jgi:predicted Fe-S protein YdhL (DUF1289 family)
MTMQRKPFPAAVPQTQGVPSPCVNVCRMNPQSGYCEGCLRTLDEIACWSGYTDEDKLAVIAKLAARRG